MKEKVIALVWFTILHFGLLEQLQQPEQAPNGEPDYFYGNPANAYESIYKLLLGVILIHCSKNSILK